MSPEQVIQELKQIKEPRTEVWTIPLKLGPHDAIAAELIEIALQRLGPDACNSDLLDVSSSMFWWCMTHLALSDPV